MRNLTQQEFQDYIGSLKYPPNRFQLKVLQSIAFGTGNIMVSALAGSGKTTLLMQIAGLLLKMGVSPEDVLFIAFNTSIRDEMTERLPGRMSAINSHSLGNRALRKAIGKRTRPNGQKYRWIFQDTLAELSQHPQVLAALGQYADEVRTLGKSVMYHTGRRFASIVGKCQLGMVDLTDIEAIRETAIHYGLDDVEGSMTDGRLEALYRLVAPLAEIGEDDARNTGRITFDEMLYLPLKWDLPLQKFPWVLGDECQDFNKTQQEILFRSLAPGGRMVLVGDPRQSIYGFLGADAHSFDTMQNRSGADVLPLNICYRCPAPVLDRARAIVPEIEVWDGHPGPDGPGVVEDIAVEQLHKHVQVGDMVLSRLNAPLISAYFDLIGNRVPARILGRDIATTLTKTLDKVAKSPGFRYSEVVPKLREYERMMAAKYAKDDKYETQAQLLEDTVECLVVCATNFDNCTSVDCLKAELDKLFADDDDASRATSVTLCSVHKAKGLEADHVVIIAPSKMPMSHPKQKAWELQQEWNILYVAITRAKRKLTVCGRLSVQPVKFGDTPPPLQSDVNHDFEDEQDVGDEPQADPIDDATIAEVGVVPLEDEQPPLASRIKIANGRTDDGAAHRGISLARDLIAAGRWDNQGEIWFDDAYAIHTAVNSSVSDVTLADLVLERDADGDLVVQLPAADDMVEAEIVEDVQAPAACPFCEGEGEVTHDGTLWVCDECDGTGNAAPDIEVQVTEEPVRTLETHEVEHHLRQLPAGKNPTRRAYALAKKFGVDLNDHPGKTFVLPHERAVGEAQPSLPGIHEFDAQLFSEPAPDNRPQQVELGISGDKPSPVLSQLAVDTALGTLDDTRPGSTLADKLMSFDEDTIDTLIDVLTHIKALKAERQEQSA